MTLSGGLLFTLLAYIGHLVLPAPRCLPAVDAGCTFGDTAALDLIDFVKDFPASHLLTVPANEIAMKRVGRPVPNAALLGAFAATTGLISLASVEKAIREKFPQKIADANVLAAGDAHEHARRQAQEAQHAQAD